MLGRDRFTLQQIIDCVVAFIEFRHTCIIHIEPLHDLLFMSVLKSFFQRIVVTYSRCINALKLLHMRFYNLVIIDSTSDRKAWVCFHCNTLFPILVKVAFGLMWSLHWWKLSKGGR